MKIYIIFLFSLVSLQLNSQPIEKYFDYLWAPCDAKVASFYSIVTKTDSGYVRNDYFIKQEPVQKSQKYGELNSDKLSKTKLSIQMKGKYADENCNISNGFFYYFYSNGNIESYGEYVDGKKNGLWLSFHWNGFMRDSTFFNLGNISGTSLSWHPNGYMSDSIVQNEDGRGLQISWFENRLPSEAGLFSEGRKKKGKWKYFHNNGEISSVEIYTNGILTEITNFDENGKQENNINNENSQAIFPGAKTAWNKYLEKSLYFPENIINALKITVVVTFAINEDGKVEDVYPSIPFYPDFDKIVLKVVSSSPKWKPAMNHNRKVKSWHTLPVTFTQKHY